ncbi:hypothetical protein RJ639_020732 [Escallonia herrerae]|uniref:DUF4005 domain-containing protein n=1 Tax=Escallonia herrerae TaxID=1293975 RepID=A0AA88V537_9ASTE|nr:hypothetical protein RJ639_020732 [Escallonia herrerae]
MSNGNYTSADTTSHSDQFERNYMANTESSKAKVRSHSEPKQRPKQSSKQKNRRTASNEGIADIEDAQSQHSSLRSSSQKNHHPWLMKLYRSTKSIREIECDSTSTTTNDSSYSKTLISYEQSGTKFKQSFQRFSSLPVGTGISSGSANLYNRNASRSLKHEPTTSLTEDARSSEVSILASPKSPAMALIHDE